MNICLKIHFHFLRMGGHFYLTFDRWGGTSTSLRSGSDQPKLIQPCIQTSARSGHVKTNNLKKHSYTLLYIYLSPVSDNDQIFEFVMSLFVAVSVALLRFVAIFALFGRLWAKLVFFLGQKKCCFFCQKSVVCLLLKQSFLDKKCTVTWYSFHITLNKICKFAITRKNDAFVAN